MAIIVFEPIHLPFGIEFITGSGSQCASSGAGDKLADNRADNGKAGGNARSSQNMSSANNMRGVSSVTRRLSASRPKFDRNT